jgi:hypothetical protein
MKLKTEFDFLLCRARSPGSAGLWDHLWSSWSNMCVSLASYQNKVRISLLKQFYVEPYCFLDMLMISYMSGYCGKITLFYNLLT